MYDDPFERKFFVELEPFSQIIRAQLCFPLMTYYRLILLNGTPLLSFFPFFEFLSFPFSEIVIQFKIPSG